MSVNKKKCCRWACVFCQCWFFIPWGLPGFLSCCCWPRPAPPMPRPRPPNTPAVAQLGLIKTYVTNLDQKDSLGKCVPAEKEHKQQMTLVSREHFSFTSANASPSFALLFVLLSATTTTSLWQHLLLYHINDLIRDSQILDGAASDVTLGHPPEFISILLESKKKVRTCKTKIISCPVCM